MTIDEAKRRLKLFGIPPEGDGAAEAREVLARVLAADSLELSDLQSARDVAERMKDMNDVDPSGLYLFLAAMRLSLKAGNTFLKLDKGAALLERAGYLEDGSDDGYKALVGGLWEKCADAAGRALEKGDQQLVVVRDVGQNEKGWFFKRVWNAVNAVSDKLKEMAAEEGRMPLPEDVVKRAVLFKGKDGQFSLNDEQKQAVRTVGSRRFTVVTGGPGTGKTTVVCAILRALMERGDVVGEDVALVAPTGRAGQRMGESIHDQCGSAVGIADDIRGRIENLSGATIHSALGGFPPNWKYTKDNRLPYKLVVVDESSMVDVHLMRALLEALPDECRLVLLGDKDQLPSVDVGAVLGDVVDSFGEPTVVKLVESNRFTADFAECAKSVNDGDEELFASSTKKLPVAGEVWTDTLSREDKDNVNRVFRYELAESVTPAACNKLFLDWVKSYGLLHDGQLVSLAKYVLPTNDVFKDGTKTDEVKNLLEQLDRSRILTVVRQGPFGAGGINDFVVTERFGGRRPMDPLTKVGVPVIVTRNTRERNLWNGDIGVTVMGPNGMTVLFPRGDKVAVCPVGLLPEHELAYAMTVHKSQGSEFENVMVVLPNDKEHPLLNRQIVYTGITRAKKRAVLLGTKAAIETALERKLERDTGIGAA